ncbi:MAG TPA: amino acid adenylation domain-containing protein [Pseudonocardiaceae bacterium]|jgi:amino acid adenylation domain-containing protein
MVANANLSTRFMATVARHADAIALVDGDTRLTYAQLDAWAASVAATLVGSGVHPGDRVGVCLPRGARLIAALLGVLRAGCTYVPLDPSYPAPRLDFMAADAEITTVLVATSTADRAPGGVVSIDVDRPCTTLDTGAHRDGHVGRAPAYIIYTSGSTGSPKGVVVSHRNVLELFDAAQRQFGFGPDDSWTMLHSYSFDFSVWEMWGPLLHGGRLVCVPEPLMYDPAGFARLLISERITVMNVVPSVFRHLIAVAAARWSGHHLRYVVFGGEPIDVTAVRRWLAMTSQPHPAIVNMFGITETTVHVTYRRVVDADLDSADSFIGVPLRHLAIDLVDGRSRPVAPGEAGEIVVSGSGVAQGYWRRPTLTAERFPTTTGPDGGLVHRFRSGDLARWSEREHSFVYLGRADSQVKIRGFRIELGELENALRGCPLVADAAVVTAQGPLGDPVLVAHVVPVRSGGQIIALVRRHLTGVLPRHLLPATMHTHQALPRTTSGKLDRRALGSVQ